MQSVKIVSRLKQWGNSVGIILPKEKIRKAELELEDEVEVVIKKKNPLAEVFGKLQMKRKTEDILKEADKELASRFD